MGTPQADGGTTIFSSTGAPLTTLVPPSTSVPTFITNYSPAGGSIAYAVTITSNGVVLPRGLTVTADGGFAVLVIVSTRGGPVPNQAPSAITASDATAPGTPLVKPLSPPVGKDQRVAVVRYSPDGRPLWIATIVDLGDTLDALFASDITTDAAGNVVVTVSYGSGSQVPGIAVSDGTQSGTATSFPDLAAASYVLKFASANGALIPGLTNAAARLLASDAAGLLVGLSPSALDAGVFASGRYGSTAAIISSGDGTRLAPVPNGGPTSTTDVLLTRLDGGLNGVWATHIGGPETDVAGDVA